MIWTRKEGYQLSFHNGINHYHSKDNAHKISDGAGDHNMDISKKSHVIVWISQNITAMAINNMAIILLLVREPINHPAKAKSKNKIKEFIILSWIFFKTNTPFVKKFVLENLEG